MSEAFTKNQSPPEYNRPAPAKPSANASDRLGQAPVGALLMRMGLPLIASMLIQALYNVVDSIFVSRIGPDAFNAVSLAFPVQNILIAISVGTGVGISTRMSHQLGQGDRKGAEQTARHGLFCAAAMWLLFALLVNTGDRWFMSLFTQKPDTIQMGIGYLSVTSTFAFGVTFQIMMERFLLATGRTVCTMWTQLAGAVINIVLDPLFIFGIGPFPELGVTGAAVATVIGQITAAVLGLILNLRFNREISLSLRGFRFRPRVVGDIYRIGSASMMIMSIASLTISGLNGILAPFSVLAVNVLGIFIKVQSFVFMPVFGLNNAMIPIISYNFGAGKRSRMLKTIRLSILLSVGVMLAGTLLVFGLARPILTLFDADEAMAAIGIPALRIISLSFPIAGFCIVLSNVFQALHKAAYSMLTTVLRQLVVLLPSAWLLAHALGYQTTWYAFPIAELASLICSLWLYRSLRRKRIQLVADNA